jgi:hypothetical protein
LQWATCARRSTPANGLTRVSAQLLFLSGVAVTIGPRSTLRFFTKRRNFRGTAAFMGGFFYCPALYKFFIFDFGT